MKIKVFFIAFILLIGGTILPVQAQNSDLPVYIVQPGDTMYSIALQFGLTVDDILAVNTMINPDWLNEGDKINIPGYEGIKGNFIPYTVQITDTYESFISKHLVDESAFKIINHITSPNEIIAGETLILPMTVEDTVETVVEPQPVYHSLMLNSLSTNPNSWEGDVSLLTSNFLANSGIPKVTNLAISPYPFQQGATSVFRFSAEPGQVLQLQVENQNIPAFEFIPGSYISFLGINAMGKTGLKEANFLQSIPDGYKVLFSQNLLANETVYPTDPIIIVEPELIDPTKTLPEEEELFSITSQTTERDLWDGTFSYPVDDACIRSPYGSIRSYNNGPYDAFHTGIDFGTCAQNLNIYAAGSGRVVYAGQWFVRGNSVVIDHGWGIYTGYWHQESFQVKVGDIVQEGQIIGTIGNTGRSTGAHLHWEVIVNSVQVNPQQWIDLVIP